MANANGFHERLDRHQPVKMGSERSFGVVFAAVFALLGLWPLTDGAAIRPWWLGAAAAMAVVTIAAPSLLRPFNKAWFALGQVLHRIVNPVVMALLFFTTITPIALIMRLTGKRPLPLKFDRAAASYWIERDPPGPDPKTMPQQF